MLPGTEESHWIRSAPAAVVHPPLDRDLSVDVAVVGAGIAGVCTAWELARAGRQVALLEADRVATGVTGHTTAKLSAQHTRIYEHLAQHFGADAAAQYAQSQQQAVEHVAHVASELRIDCELERCAAYTYTGDGGDVEALRAEAEAARRAGLTAEFTVDTPLPFPVAGAVRVDGQAQFHPRKYLLALVEDLVARGAHVHERTRIAELDQGPPLQVVTEHGATVTAEHVVVATSYPVFDRAMLFPRLSVTRELVVAATVPTEQVPTGVFITEDENTRSVRSAPWDEARRLLIVTGEHFSPGTGDVTASWGKLLDWTRQQFPAAEVVYRWAAQDTHSLDRVPFIGPFPVTENAWVATGFGGWGMSNEVLARQLLTDPAHLPRRLPRGHPTGPGRAHLGRRQALRRLPRPRRPSECRVGHVHAPRLSGALQRRRDHLGVPLPRLPLRHRRHRPPGAGYRPSGETLDERDRRLTPNPATVRPSLCA